MDGFNWSPGIGDPSLGGWITVALYLVTAYFCWRVAREIGAGGGGARSEALVWGGIALLFLLLGINKQLDLQSAFTEIARVISHAQGWYENRRSVQVAFIGVIGAICLIVGIGLLIMIRGSPMATWLAAAGTLLVLTFVAVRAASFHHVDQFIKETVFGLRWNWILEMGGILLVLAATRLRRTARR